MRKRSEVVYEEKPTADFIIPVDTVNESVILAAALVASDEVRERLLVRIQPEHFLNEEHRTAWHALLEIRRRKLSVDLATIQQIAGDRVRTAYLVSLIDARPDAPTNLEYHVDALMWDRRRVQAARGPLSALLEAIRDPKHPSDRVRALARHLADSFDGYSDKQYIYDPSALVADAMADIRKRVRGQAIYPYGVDGLDFYPDIQHGKRRRRMVPGAAPGQITFVTGTSGSGKSALSAHFALGIAKTGQRVTYGAWEVKAPMTIEQIALLELGISRAKVLDPNGAFADGAFNPSDLVRIEEMMHKLSKLITFVRNPFRRMRGQRSSNDANLDLIQSILADTACDVFIADLWRRCLTSVKPEHEEDAVFRQQAMLEEMGVHGILVHQQLIKGNEIRNDHRPSKEGMKGSGAYFEAADTVLGTFRQAMWKDVPDDEMEVVILKQRQAEAGMSVIFEWSPTHGSIKGGRSAKYNAISVENETGMGSRFTPIRRSNERSSSTRS